MVGYRQPVLLNLISISARSISWARDPQSPEACCIFYYRYTATGFGILAGGDNLRLIGAITFAK